MEALEAAAVLVMEELVQAFILLGVQQHLLEKIVVVLTIMLAVVAVVFLEIMLEAHLMAVWVVVVVVVSVLMNQFLLDKTLLLELPILAVEVEAKLETEILKVALDKQVVQEL